MNVDTFFYWLFNLLIVLSVVAVIYLIMVMYRVNKILKGWDKVSEKASTGILEIIPAVITTTNVIKGVQKIFNIIEDKKSQSKKEK